VIVADGLFMLLCETEIYVGLSLHLPHVNLFSCGFYNWSHNFSLCLQAYVEKVQKA